MPTKRILILPGATRADDPEYQPVYELIRRGATLNYSEGEYEYQQVIYPGQDDVSTQNLNCESALRHIRNVCEDFQPTWIVRFSFGDYLSVALLAISEVQASSWFSSLEGCVIWGASTRQNLDEYIPDEERKKAVDKLRVRRPSTHVSDDFFDTFPDTERLIELVSCNLRLAYGRNDSSINPVEVNRLLTKRQYSTVLKSAYLTELIVIEELGHNVGKIQVGQPCQENPDRLSEYFDCLFDPIGSYHSSTVGGV
jgi:hypothetical protein